MRPILYNCCILLYLCAPYLIQLLYFVVPLCALSSRLVVFCRTSVRRLHWMQRSRSVSKRFGHFSVTTTSKSCLRSCGVCLPVGRFFLHKNISHNARTRNVSGYPCAPVLWVAHSKFATLQPRKGKTTNTNVLCSTKYKVEFADNCAINRCMDRFTVFCQTSCDRQHGEMSMC